MKVASPITLANPGPLGLFGFAMTTWLLAMVNAGWFGVSATPMVLAMAFAFGGAAQFCAGLLMLPRGDTFGFTAFCAYGAFWLSYAIFAGVYSGQAPQAMVGWYLFVWAIFTFVMWIGTFRANRALQLTFLAAWIEILLLAVGQWTSPLFTQAGGYVGMVTALLAFYVASATVIDDSYNAEVLPLGAYPKAEAGGATQAIAAQVAAILPGVRQPV
jgi:succinate-acetate transporter protein